MALWRKVGFGLRRLDLRLIAAARRSGRVRRAIGLIVKGLVGTSLKNELNKKKQNEITYGAPEVARCSRARST